MPSSEPPVTAARSENMRRIGRRNTGPELVVRKLLHSRGWRYRIHVRGLPGTPDIVFPGRKKAIFIHGCFWHGHDGCPLSRLPKTRSAFWEQKIGTNKRRDRAKAAALTESGWRVFTVWQCELKDPVKLLSGLESFLRVG
ncbi:MAG TPA: very short patch repair endonuclease [Allosphingosinicella sp.]